MVRSETRSLIDSKRIKMLIDEKIEYNEETKEVVVKGFAPDTIEVGFGKETDLSKYLQYYETYVYGEKVYRFSSGEVHIKTENSKWIKMIIGDDEQ